MKIIRLTAENVKRLRAVEIEPDGTLQVITGRNAQGKTSVLDAIWLALGGGAASRETTQPVRDGEDHASVTLDLGDLKVTRSWTHHGKTSLKVTSAEGAAFSSPQRMLDELVGRLSFDPLEFTRLSAREQVAALLDLVDLDIDLDELAVNRQRLYEERTEIGRQGKSIGDAVVDESLPTSEASAQQIIDQINEATQRSIQQQREADEVDALEASIQATRQRLAEMESQHATAKALVAKHEPLPNVDELRADLSQVEDVNAKVRANNAARESMARKAALADKYNELSARITKLDTQRTKALAAAKFPVDGLGFDDQGVTYNGVPFSQASAAEQIRVSLAMAMSLNPKLRVIRILDGSLLDAENMKLITEMATAADYQVWVERVEDSSESAVVIEDGQVVS